MLSPFQTSFRSTSSCSYWQIPGSISSIVHAFWNCFHHWSLLRLTNISLKSHFHLYIVIWFCNTPLPHRHISLADVARHMLSLNPDGFAAVQCSAFYKFLCQRGTFCHLTEWCWSRAIQRPCPGASATFCYAPRNVLLVNSNLFHPQ